MFTVVRYLPIPRDFTPSDPSRPEGLRPESLVDLSLLLYILNPKTTPEEESVLRRLRAARVPERLRPVAPLFRA
jgi:hypothetical protein